MEIPAELTLNAHPEKWDKLLDDARKAIAAGRDALLPFEDEHGTEGEIRLVADSAEFGLEDPPFIEPGT
jgi:hypothetical protein